PQRASASAPMTRDRSEPTLRPKKTERTKTMKLRSMLIAVAGLVASMVLVGAAVAAPKSATLTIRHQVKGCHTWAFTGGAWNATQSITLARGAKLMIVDNDVMPHKLVQLSGPQAKLTTPAMKHMGAQAS